MVSYSVVMQPWDYHKRKKWLMIKGNRSTEVYFIRTVVRTLIIVSMCHLFEGAYLKHKDPNQIKVKEERECIK